MLKAGLGGHYGQRRVNMGGPWVDWLGFWPVSFCYNALHWTEYSKQFILSVPCKVYCCTYNMPSFAHITTRYHPKPFLSGAIEKKKLERSVSILCTFEPLATMFRHPLLEHRNASVINFALFVPMHLAWLDVKQSIFYVQLCLAMLYPPILALIVCLCCPFHLGCQDWGLLVNCLARHEHSPSFMLLSTVIFELCANK